MHDRYRGKGQGAVSNPSPDPAGRHEFEFLLSYVLSTGGDVGPSLVVLRSSLDREWGVGVRGPNYLIRLLSYDCCSFPVFTLIFFLFVPKWFSPLVVSLVCLHRYFVCPVSFSPFAIVLFVTL